MLPTVRQATVDDLEQLIPLFDAYRQFYDKPADVELARRFLSERFQHHESVIFIAVDAHGIGLGFTQLYPSFSSTRAARIYMLNDLFVVPSARRKGVAAQLLRAAANYGKAVGAVRLGLSTAISNAPAQRLYETLGWQRDESFCEYTLLL